MKIYRLLIGINHKYMYWYRIGMHIHADLITRNLMIYYNNLEELLKLGQSLTPCHLRLKYCDKSQLMDKRNQLHFTILQ